MDANGEKLNGCKTAKPSIESSTQKGGLLLIPADHRVEHTA